MRRLDGNNLSLEESGNHLNLEHEAISGKSVRSYGIRTSVLIHNVCRSSLLLLPHGLDTDLLSPGIIMIIMF
jgi:hypothetical protein